MKTSKLIIQKTILSRYLLTKLRMNKRRSMQSLIQMTITLKDKTILKQTLKIQINEAGKINEVNSFESFDMLVLIIRGLIS